MKHAKFFSNKNTAELSAKVTIRLHYQISEAKVKFLTQMLHLVMKLMILSKATYKGQKRSNLIMGLKTALQGLECSSLK